ncbi:MAG: GntR family transcriptional regulator [Propionibacteriales bacterium]|nr:GntR family transcriptional regulator [Propionibacteriales bacterium]
MANSATSSASVADRVRDMILDGRLAPGARIGEAELAGRLGVSRTPVREALNRLGAERLVEHSPNRGARVATWTIAEIESVFELRSTLEPRLTALAVPAATEQDIALLADLAEHMLAVGLPGSRQDLHAVVSLNRAFHEHLVGLADHTALANALATAVKAPMQRHNFSTYDERTLRRSLAHHVEIVDAIRAGDPTWAQAVMTAHIHNARAVMVRAATDQEESP